MKSLLDTQRNHLLTTWPGLQRLADHLSATAKSAMARSETVTVVITCKNKVATLPHVLDRIAGQTRRPDLVVLADDASTDQSVPVAIDLCRAHGLPWKLAALPAGGNYRLNTIRNMGFAASLDGLVMLIDGDLILSPSYIERHHALHAGRDIPVVSMGPRFEYANDAMAGPINFMWGYGAEQQTLGQDGYLPAWQRASGAINLPRAVWTAIGGFDEGYNGKYGIDDLDFMFRLFLAEVYPVCDFEGYTIHVPHPTTFDGGVRDPHGNMDYFCDKYGVSRLVLHDPLDFAPLHKRTTNWAGDFATFFAQAVA